MSSLYATKGAVSILSSLSHSCCCSDAGMSCWKAQWSAEATLGVSHKWMYILSCPIHHQLPSLRFGGLWSWCNQRANCSPCWTLRICCGNHSPQAWPMRPHPATHLSDLGHLLLYIAECIYSSPPTRCYALGSLALGLASSTSILSYWASSSP